MQVLISISQYPARRVERRRALLWAVSALALYCLSGSRKFWQQAHAYAGGRDTDRTVDSRAERSHSGRIRVVAWRELAQAQAKTARH